MRVSKITDIEIIFDNGFSIYFDHNPISVEENYADFQKIDKSVFDYDFDENLSFEHYEGKGFTFGDENNTFFVPCISEITNIRPEDADLYLRALDIIFNYKKILTVECKEVVLNNRRRKFIFK